MRLNMYGRCLALAVAAGVVLATLPTASAQTPWVLIARKAAGKVQQIREGANQPGQPGYDFATVILEAPADRVFATALDLARKNRSVHVLMSDPGARRLQIGDGQRTATLSVMEFSPEVSQLLIAGTAAPGEGGTASRVVAAVMRVCAEMKKECQVER